MRLLIDTNIVLEVLLDQEKAPEAQTLLARTDHELFLSDFSLHSIGLILFRRKQHEVFRQFLNDMVLRAGATLVFLSGQEMEAVADVGLGSNLDFDDAYQYALAERYALIIVSFDSDFDRTALGRLTPADIV